MMRMFAGIRVAVTFLKITSLCCTARQVPVLVLVLARVLVLVLVRVLVLVLVLD